MGNQYTIPELCTSTVAQRFEYANNASCASSSKLKERLMYTDTSVEK